MFGDKNDVPADVCNTPVCLTHCQLSGTCALPLHNYFLNRWQLGRDSWLAGRDSLHLSRSHTKTQEHKHKNTLHYSIFPRHHINTHISRSFFWSIRTVISDMAGPTPQCSLLFSLLQLFSLLDSPNPYHDSGVLPRSDLYFGAHETFV